MRGFARGAAAAIAIGVALLAAGPASAAPISCNFDAGAERPTLKVSVKGRTIVRMRVNAGAIQVADNSGTPIACTGGSPTDANTDQINAKATGKRGRGGQTILVQDPASFAPGAEDEPLGADEIEWKVALGRGRDTLLFLGGDGDDHVTAGTDGVNMNASVLPFSNDIDYVLKQVELLDLRGGQGSDEISAGGGDGTGKAWPRGVDLSDSGTDGNDIYIGGAGDDDIAAGVGNDALNGRKGDDELIGAPGDDSLAGGKGDDELGGNADADLIDGGPGVDTAEYGDLNGSPVIVDIGAGGDNDGGPVDGPPGDRDEVTASVENLAGESEVDEFVGDNDANVLIGGPGMDSLFGRGGNDSLRARDGLADLQIHCGAGRRDKAHFDPGLDPKPVSC
jgi:Ca2+-binding RTX toxin-like protein